MAAAGLTLPARPHRRAPMGALLILVLMVVLAATALPPIQRAHTRHQDHPESVAVRGCFEQRGGAQHIYRDRDDPDKFYLLCQIPDGPYQDQWGLRVIVRDAEGWWEKSTFVPKDGSWARVVEYLLRFATRWTRALP